MQKAPQQIVIREKEDWAEVADPRIRFVCHSQELNVCMLTPSL